MRVSQTDPQRLVLSQYLVVLRLVGGLALALIIAILLFATAAQRVRCDAELGRRCEIIESRLLWEWGRQWIPADAVKRIGVDLVRGDEENTYCVKLWTHNETVHEIGRCSSKEEAYLARNAKKLSAFYAGKADSFETHRDDRGIYWFIIAVLTLFGLMFLVLPPFSRVVVDRRRGMLTIRGWRPFHWVRHDVRLEQIRHVAVQFDSVGSDGEQLDVLLLQLTDGERIKLNSPTNAALIGARAALQSFLGQIPCHVELGSGQSMVAVMARAGTGLLKCPFCLDLLRASSEELVVVCGSCQTAQHSSCWAEAGNRCSIFGCTGDSSRSVETTSEALA